jgi:hypothetical protein
MMAMSLLVISLSIHEHDCPDCYVHDRLDDRDIRGVYCSLPLWRVHEIKRMYLAPRTHGLFIT